MSAKADPEISVVVPCFNSEKSLVPLVSRLQQTLAAANLSFEAILVEDGSRDVTWEVIQDLARRYGFVRGVKLMRNYGQHNALLCGIRMARAPFVITLDDDLQNPPEEIPRLLARLQEGYDVVYGTPSKPAHHFFRRVASYLTKLALQRSMGAETARSVSAFRAFRTRLRDAFAGYSGAFVSIDVLLTWGGNRFTAVEVRNDPRLIGTSNYTLGKLVLHALNLITGFSTAPLRVASLTGILFTILGSGLLAYVLGRYLISGSPVPGFPFLASTVIIFSGAQLFALGIIGEYLGRIHVRSMDQPSFAIDATTDEDADAS